MKHQMAPDRDVCLRCGLTELDIVEHRVLRCEPVEDPALRAHYLAYIRNKRDRALVAFVREFDRVQRLSEQRREGKRHG